MFSLFRQRVTPAAILKEYRRLQAIRESEELLIFGTPRNVRHARQYDKLKKMVRDHQDQLLELVFSGELNERELHDLIHFGGHGGSVAKRHNEDWAPFVARVRERQEELPESVQSSLDWLLRVHGW